MAYQTTKIVDSTPAVTAGAYSAGDVVGGLLSFKPGVDRGVIRSVILIDDAAQDVALKLYLFDSAPTSIADNAAISGLVEADYEKFLGSVSISTYDTVVNAAYVTDANVAFDIVSSGTLYAYLVTNGSTPTYAATDDITLRLVIWSD